MLRQNVCLVCIIFLTSLYMANAEEMGSKDDDKLPLGFYLTKKNLSDVQKWYAAGKGEAWRFNEEIRQHYLERVQATRDAIDPKCNKYQHPSGFGWHALSACGFAYALTGEERYGIPVRDVLRYYLRIPNWTTHPTIPFEEAFIARQTVICADLIYPLLTAEEREAIALSLEQKGLKVLRHYIIKGSYTWSTNQETWAGNPGYLQESNQAFVYLGAIYASACYLYHQTKEVRYRDEAVKSARAVRMVLRKLLDVDGSACASTSYYMMTLWEAAVLLNPMAKTLNMTVEEFLPPGARNPFRYAFYLRSNANPHPEPERYPYMLRFGDSKTHSSWLVYDPIKNKPRGVHSQPFAVWSGLVKDPEILWIYKNCVDLPGVRYVETPGTLVAHYKRFLLEKEITPIPLRLEKEKLFRNNGLLLWRDGFRQGDKLFALWKRVCKRGDHVRNTQNYIQLEAFGESYLTDPGLYNAKGAASYNNCSLTINRENCSDGWSRLPIRPYIVSERMNYARSDASYRGPFGDPLHTRRHGGISKKADHAVRSVVYVKPDYYILSDIVHTTEPATVECNFISARKYEIDKRWVQYRGKHSSLYQYEASPEQRTFVTKTLTDDQGEKKYLLHVETGKKVRDVAMLNLFFPLSADRKPPEVKAMYDWSGTWLKVKRGDCHELVVQRRYDAMITRVNKIETDCELLILCYENDKLTNGGFFQGTYLIIDGRRVLTTNKTISLIFQLMPAGNIFGEAQVDTETRVTFSFWKKPLDWTLSGFDQYGNVPFCSFR